MEPVHTTPGEPAQVTLDAKRRFVVPGVFRPQFVTPSLDRVPFKVEPALSSTEETPALRLVSRELWLAEFDSVLPRGPLSASEEAYLHERRRLAVTCSIDGRNRIGLPPHLVQFLGVEVAARAKLDMTPTRDGGVYLLAPSRGDVDLTVEMLGRIRGIHDDLVRRAVTGNGGSRA